MSVTNLDVANAALSKLGADEITSLNAANAKAKVMNLRIEPCKWALLRMHPWNFATKRVQLGPVTITGAADNGGGLIQITAVGHGLSTGDYVKVIDVGGTTEAVGNWTVSVIDDDTLDLDASTFTNAYTSGGEIGKAPAHGYDWLYDLPSDFIRFLNTDEPGFNYEWLVENVQLATNVNPIKIIYIANVTNYGLMDVLFRECLASYLAWDTCYRITQSEKLKDQLWQDFRLLLPKTRFVDATEDSLRKLGSDEFVRSRFGHNIGYVRDGDPNY